VAGELFIRADAGTLMGTGHVMRCLALAQAWQDKGGRALFLMADGVDSLGERLRTEEMEVQKVSQKSGSREDAVKAAATARKLNTSWIVVDGYQFNTNYQRIIKESGLRLLFIDDNGHCDHYYADIVLNQNLHADESMYPNKEPYTKLLLGTKYVLLRREFLKYRNWKREIPDVARKVLVTMGGSDPDNVTLKVIKALQQTDIDNLQVIVVVGASNPHYEKLQKVASECQFKIELRRNVTNMPELMSRADVAVASVGTTSWELAFMRLPPAILVLADNQEKAANLLTKKKIVLLLGYGSNAKLHSVAQVVKKLLLNRELRQELSHNGLLLVDGSGSIRVAEYLSES